MPHPGAIVPLIRKPQFVVAVPKGMKVAIGVGCTTHPLAVRVDMYILTLVPVEKSSKKACGTPWLSTTTSEHCSADSVPLTICGAENGSPAPGECDSTIAEPNAGMVPAP